MTHRKNFKTMDELETYLSKLTDKYLQVKYEICIIHNWYRLYREMLP